jgi:hypothetical protein
MLWVGIKDGSLVLNTETHRKRYENVEADPRITVLIRDENDPYRYAEVRGTVTRITTGDQAHEHIDELAHRYLGTDYPPEGIKWKPRCGGRRRPSDAVEVFGGRRRGTAFSATSRAGRAPSRGAATAPGSKARARVARASTGVGRRMSSRLRSTRSRTS